MPTFIFAAIPSFNIIPSSGIMNTIFHQTDLSIQILGWPAKGYHINLIQLIILIVLAVVVNFVIEWLTKSKSGLVTGVILTVIGAYLLQTFAKIPFDFAFERRVGDRFTYWRDHRWCLLHADSRSVWWFEEVASHTR